MSCDHVGKVLEWGFGSNMEWQPTLWGCTNCDIISADRVSHGIIENNINHDDCDNNPCFRCKAMNLQISTGDASSNKIMSDKKWNGELDAYRDARRQGIQPAATTMKAIEEAKKASDAMGKAYDANTMTNANLINKKSAKSLTEAGAI